MATDSSDGRGGEPTRKFKRGFDAKYLVNFHWLTEEQQKVLDHHFGLHGKPKLSDAEIAELLRSPGVNTINIKAMVSSAIARLREVYERTTAHQRTTGPDVPGSGSNHSG
jgi:DNA-directed RNA polymerase sigma subunit (sigma70/sigma32)